MRFLVFIIYILLINLNAGNSVESDDGFTVYDLVKIFMPQQDQKVIVESDDVTRFFIIGDYGELSNYLNIRKVSVLMDQIASQKNFSHIITAGDNFYSDGITNINFRLKPWIVTNLFQRESIGRLKIYPTLGNHDCHVDYRNEILYSNYNNQWVMNNDYYEIKTPMKDDPSKYFVNLMVNSWKLLCPDEKYTDKKEWDKIRVKVGSKEVTEHYDWFRSKLEQYRRDSNVAWLAITLHHPPFLQNVMKQRFLPLLREYYVDFIFAGHEHWSEYTNMDGKYQTRFPPNTPSIIKNWTNDSEIIFHEEREQTFKRGSHIHQFISGNGGHSLRKICPHYDQDGEVYFKNNGYYGTTTVEATSKKVTVSFYRGVNDIVYQINVVQ